MATGGDVEERRELAARVERLERQVRALEAALKDAGATPPAASGAAALAGGGARDAATRGASAAPGIGPHGPEASPDARARRAEGLAHIAPPEAPAPRPAALRRAAAGPVGGISSEQAALAARGGPAPWPARGKDQWRDGASPRVEGQSLRRLGVMRRRSEAGRAALAGAVRGVAALVVIALGATGTAWLVMKYAGGGGGGWSEEPEVVIEAPSPPRGFIAFEGAVPDGMVLDAPPDGVIPDTADNSLGALRERAEGDGVATDDFADDDGFGGGEETSLPAVDDGAGSGGGIVSVE